MTRKLEEIRAWRVIMLYSVALHGLSVPNRSKEHATDILTRQSETTQAVWRANCNFRVVMSSFDVKVAYRLPQPDPIAAAAMQKPVKETTCRSVNRV
jgi:hypothetical protein